MAVKVHTTPTRYKNIELVQLLLEYRADLEIKDSNGNTPFTLAKEAGSQEIENLLLQWMR